MDDDYLWLEEVDGENALNWVKQQNSKTFEIYGESQNFLDLRQEMISLMDDKEKIPYPRIRGNYVYNFWTDAKNVKGLWRRTSLKSYLSGSPQWDILLDIDKLSKDEGKSWVFHGVSMLNPDQEFCLVNLSPGGTDASETREFNLKTKKFVEGGFYIPVNKGGASWLDKDTLFVSTTLKENDKTSSGYPRVVRLWKRGTKLEDAKEIYAGNTKDVSCGAYPLDEKTGRFLIYQGLTFYTREIRLWQNGKLKLLNLPKDSSIRGFKNEVLFVELKSDWKGFKTGSLVALDFKKLLEDKYDVTAVFTPDAKTSLSGFSISKSHAFLNVIEDVKGKVYQVSLDGKYTRQEISLPANGRTSIVAVDDEVDDVIINYQGFLKPSTMYHFDGENLKEYKSRKAKFDASPYVVNQQFAISKDGTKVPYFIVHRKDIELNGENPTLLYGYGGFQISQKPYYSSFSGRFWLQKGGVFVMSNIRGGGEYGPKWHQSAIKYNKHKSYDDFIAIAEDLISKKVTSPQKLAIKGGSNGGLLMGVMLTRRPDLFKAVLCQVPLLDMVRFNKLLAGASWMGEYGNPDNEKEKEYILTYSPFHNLKKNTEYPEVFFMTSTKDDRVHPGHARKMALKMIDQGHKIHYYENIEGGHGGAADLKQRATWNALEYVYLYDKLKMK